MKLWKTLRITDGKLASEHGGETWEIGKWHKIDGELAMCGRGYHASLNIVDAMQYVAPDALALVEVRGKHLKQDDKQCWEEMRVVKAWKWTKEDSVALAIYAAELALGIYKKQYPDDKRPRTAIGAARAWLKNPCDETLEVAGDATMTKIHRWIVRHTKEMKEIK